MKRKPKTKKTKFKAPRVPRQYSWAVDLDEKFKRDLEANPEAAEFYRNFLRDEYDMGAFARDESTAEERSVGARNVRRQRTDAMNNRCLYAEDVKFRVGKFNREGNDTSLENLLVADERDENTYEGFDYLNTEEYKELREEFRSTLKQNHGLRHFAPEPSRKREKVQEAMTVAIPFLTKPRRGGK